MLELGGGQRNYDSFVSGLGVLDFFPFDLVMFEGEIQCGDQIHSTHLGMLELVGNSKPATRCC